MAKGEGRGEGGTESGEDLFEDLDKFFAPIQDVDWPETTEPAARRSQQEREDEAEPAAAEASEREPSPFEAPIRIERVEDEASDEPTVGQEDLFTGHEPAEAAEPAEPAATGEAEDDADDGVSTFLFESETEEEAAGEISREAFAEPPDAYANLPGPDDVDAAELDEGEVAVEPAPDLEAVEAAADHFAESVRSEEGEGEPSGARTEEIQIAALLGDDVDDDDEEPVRPEATRTVRVGAEGLGGPSWQEPTAMEVGAEPERRAGRDVPLAFVTGLALALVALGALAIGPGAFAVVAGVLVLLAQGEFYFALQKRHYQPATALALVAGALVLGAAYYRGEDAMLAIVGLTVVASFLWYMTVPPQHRRNVVSNVALTVLGVIYIPLLAGYAFIVLELADGRALALSIIGLTVAYDVAAFVVGTWWGSRPLAPNVSPKKSWEGAIGATFVTAAVAVGAVAPAVEALDTIPRAVGLAVVVGVFAPLGDLAESLLKRDLDLKDMGSILPGHGGVLDRIDAMLFVAPAAFMYLRLVVL